jgi:hypothetical protein
MMFEEFKSFLEAQGYKFSWYYRGEVETYLFTKETHSIDLAPHLPMEKVHRALSKFKVGVSGLYTAKLTVEGGLLRKVEHGFAYHIKAERERAFALIRVYGPMDAPFPNGRPMGYDIDAYIFIGPEPMGKGQKARARQAVKEVLASLPEFVEAFPEARVYAKLETRGGRGGWKAKTARHEMGRVRDWVEEVMR